MGTFYDGPTGDEQVDDEVEAPKDDSQMKPTLAKSPQQPTVGGKR